MADKIPVLSGSKLKQMFGSFTYTNTGGGRIRIASAWTDANLTDCVLADANRGRDVRTQCHVKAKEPLERAFREVAERDLSRLIRTYDGLWVPRHMVWNNSRPLSRHSWGVAFDLNAQWNAYGNGISPENRALNEIFNAYGFAWGGDWRAAIRDAMHWELADPDAWAGRMSVPDESKDLILAVQRGEDEWSYHRLKSAVLTGGRFMVVQREVATLFGKTASDAKSPIRDYLASLQVNIVNQSDKLDDPKDPRLYLFVRAA